MDSDRLRWLALMKVASDIKPNFGPVYAAAMYPELAKLFQSHGYALAVRGSLARDFDLVAIPWAETVSGVPAMMDAIEAVWAVKFDREPAARNHGRVAYSLSLAFGECAIDLSFFPSL
jgi:hypothetical protein